MSIQEFLYMGGYYPFVWPAYGLALLVLAINVLTPRLRERRILRRIAKRETAARRNE